MSFQDRLIAACDQHPDIPAKGQGRFAYLAAKTDTAVGSVRRWFEGGEPRTAKIAALAKVLEVDAHWLAAGDPSFADVQDLLRLSSADVFAFAAYLVNNGCMVGSSEANSSTLTAVNNGRAFHFQLVAGRVNKHNQLELDPTAVMHEKDHIRIASVRCDSPESVSQVCYQFIDLADIAMADGVIWCPDSQEFKSGGMALAPLCGIFS